MGDLGSVRCAAIEEQESIDDKKPEPQWGPGLPTTTISELLHLEPKLKSSRLNLKLLLCLRSRAKWLLCLDLIRFRSSFPSHHSYPDAAVMVISMHTRRLSFLFTFAK